MEYSMKLLMMSGKYYNQMGNASMFKKETIKKMFFNGFIV